MTKNVKLSLNRETVRSLVNPDLQEIVGGDGVLYPLGIAIQRIGKTILTDSQNCPTNLSCTNCQGCNSKPLQTIACSTK